MVWQRNDDQYGVSRKVTRIPRQQRLAAVGLDQLAKNYSVRALTDGVLDDVELGEVLATPKLVDVLVTAGMWHRAGHDCNRCVQPPQGGIVIHDFLEYNPSRAQVESDREKDRIRKGRGKDSGGNPAGLQKDSIFPGPVPGPVPQTDVTTHGPSVTEVDASAVEEDMIKLDATAIGLNNIPRARAAIEIVTGPLGPLGDALTVDITRSILTLSSRHVGKVEAYVETTCLNSPAEVIAIFERIPGPQAVAS